MKVYVVQIDNGQEYSDYENWIDSIFKSYRFASQHLIDKGFIPYPHENHLGEWILLFENPMVVGYGHENGWITEFEIQN